MSPNKSEYQTALLHESEGVCLWRQVATFPSISMVIGLDEEGNWVEFVEQTRRVIRAYRHRMLYFFRLLDLEHAEVVSKFYQASKALTEDDLVKKSEEFIDMLVEDALGSRTSAYVTRAVCWSKSISVSVALRAALLDLAGSKRGTQGDRQAARQLLRNYRV